MTNRNDTVLAFLLGAVAGGITAILLAPDKGSETRRKLRHAANSTVQRGEATAQRYADTAKGKLHEATEAARTHVAAVKEAVAEGRDTYRRELNKS